MLNKYLKLLRVIFFYLVLFSCVVYAEDKIIWSVDNNFRNEIYRLKGIDLKNINGKPVYYESQSINTVVDDTYDLFLSFDSKLDLDETSNYRIRKQSYRVSENTAVKRKSAFFINDGDFIELVGSQNYLFEAGKNIDSFTIGFWIYPATLTNNEVILRIGSQFYNQQTDKVEDQSIICYINDGKISWFFNELFISSSNHKKSIKIDASTRLKSKEWTFVELSYDAFTGIIRLSQNSVEEGIVIATTDGSSQGSVLPLRYNERNQCRIVLGDTFVGGIDEFFIKKTGSLTPYDILNTDSEIVSKVFSAGKYGSKLIDRQFNQKNRDQSVVLYYVRSSMEPFSPDSFGITGVPVKISIVDFISIQHRCNEMERSLLKSSYRLDVDKYVLVDMDERSVKKVVDILKKYAFYWTNISKNFIPGDLSGKHYQWKAVFLSGKTMGVSSTFSGIELSFDYASPPSPPKNFEAAYIDGTIYLKWIMNSEKNIKGYRVYYGLKSGEYFGDAAIEGKSPIKIGKIDKFKLSGINDKRIYYIGLTAFTDDNGDYESEFSDEITIRPYQD